jgi:hypothetical protein
MTRAAVPLHPPPDVPLPEVAPADIPLPLVPLVEVRPDGSVGEE